MPKGSSGISKSKSGGKTQAELKKTQTELAQTKAELEQLKADYAELIDRINSINEQAMSQVTKQVTQANSKYAAPTVANMKGAYDELHKFREFVRICDLRRELNWSREDFNDMMRKLRDNRTIQLFRADESMMTRDEIQDCFIDDRNFIMGILTWNGR